MSRREIAPGTLAGELAEMTGQGRRSIRSAFVWSTDTLSAHLRDDQPPNVAAWLARTIDGLRAEVAFLDSIPMPVVISTADWETEKNTPHEPGGLELHGDAIRALGYKPLLRWQPGDGVLYLSGEPSGIPGERIAFDNYAHHTDPAWGEFGMAADLIAWAEATPGVYWEHVNAAVVALVVDHS